MQRKNERKVVILNEGKVVTEMKKSGKMNLENFNKDKFPDTEIS